jgi:2-methylcitrate dehydratase PrpD
VCAYRHPKTPFEAKFSLSYTVAARLVLGRVREKAFLPENFSHPDIVALEDKIALTIDQECADQFPKRRSAKIEIVLNDGRVLQRHQLTRHGDPDDPMTDQELMDKYLELVEPRIGQDSAQRMANTILKSNDASMDDISRYWRA